MASPVLRGFQDTRRHVRTPESPRLLAERTRHMSTLIRWPKSRLCPPFCPPFKVVFRPQGDIRGYRGRQETGRFYWRFLFCSGKSEGKNGSGGERSNPLATRAWVEGEKITYAQRSTKENSNSEIIFVPFCGLTCQVVNGGDDPERNCGDESGGGDGENPGPDDAACDAPLYRGQPSCGTDADDRASNCVSGRNGCAGEGDVRECQGGGGLGAEAADGFEFRNLSSHRAHDAPASRHRS